MAEKPPLKLEPKGYTKNHRKPKEWNRDGNAHVVVQKEDIKDSHNLEQLARQSKLRKLQEPIAAGYMENGTETI